VVNDGCSAVQDAALELKLFQMLTQLPLTAITSFIGIVLMVVFFITSSDSGSLGPVDVHFRRMTVAAMAMKAL